MEVLEENKFNKPENRYSISKLKDMTNKISELQEPEHIEILKIIKNDDYNYTENKNGIFINMRKLNYSTLRKLEDFIDFCENNQSFFEQDDLKRESLNGLLNNDLNKN